MIYADLSDFLAMAAPGKALAVAVEFLRDRAADLPDGRHELGDGMYAEIRAYSPAPAGERRWERHAKFVDVHCVLEGAEEMLVRPSEGMTVSEDLLAAKDLAFLEEPADGGALVLRLFPGRFLMTQPWDAHKSECRCGVDRGRKAVVKIPAGPMNA